MKKIIPIILVGILVLSGLGAVSGTESVKEELKSNTIAFSKPVIVEKDDYVSIEIAEATTNSWNKDLPMLPLVSRVYTFPFGTTIEDVKVTFSENKEMEITQPIIPSPEVYILSSATQKTVEKPKEILTYSDIDIYPEQRYSYTASAGLKDGQHVLYLSIGINPVQYKPNENKIYYSDIAEIDVKYTLPERELLTADVYDLLILTPSQFESTLQRLVDFKNNMNPPINTKLVTLDEIYSGTYFPATGIDNQEKIKYFVKNAIENWGIDYVILVGAGVEGEELFPVRKAWVPSGSYEDNFPSDLYYADVYDATGGFPDWDEDNDGKYAEYPGDIPSMDVHPDVYLSRIPCNNADELNTMIDKIIYYKEHNKMTNKIVQAGGDTFSLVDGDNSGIYEGEYANTKVMEKLPGYSTTQLWGSNDQLTKGNIAKGFKDNVDFVDLSGHGSPISWATHPPLVTESIWIPPEELISPYTGWLIYDFDLFMVNNQYKYPVVVYNSCSNNKFSANEQCMGWKTLSKNGGGGIAAFAASGIGYGAYGTDETKRVMGWMEVRIFEEMIAVEILGEAWGNCISGYYNAFEGNLNDGDYKTMLEFCMFGDPSLAVQDGDDPKSEGVFFQPSPFLHILEKLMDRFPLLERMLSSPLLSRLFNL